MILVAAVWVATAAYALRRGREATLFALAAVATLAVLAGAWGIESLLRGFPLLRSDEAYYWYEATLNPVPEFDSERTLWFFVNWVLGRLDVGVGGLSVKLVNVPLYILLVLSLHRHLGSRRIWLILPLLPYGLWISFFNFRDQLIVLLTTWTFIGFSGRQVLGLSVVSLTGLFLLRPIVAVITLAIFVAVKMRGHIVKSAALFSAVGAACAIAFGDALRSRFVSTILWVQYTLGEGREARLLELDATAADPTTISGLARAVGQFVLAPLPHSLLHRALDGGEAQWGSIDDLVRLVHQVGLYVILAWLTFNWRSVWRAARDAAPELRGLLAAFLVYLPLYSVHLFGAVHSRTKWPFHLALFVLFVIASKRDSADASLGPEQW